MKKSILITGATDGIGFETAKILVSHGHSVIIHGRNAGKLDSTKTALAQLNDDASIDVVKADLTNMSEVDAMASDLLTRGIKLDALINNAGVFKIHEPVADNGYDKRFLVNTIAPFLLTMRLRAQFNPGGRVVNLSSAAQAPVSLNALLGNQTLSDSAAYAQSKLALTMWTFERAQTLSSSGLTFIAVNPASFLGSKMVKEAYGTAGKDLRIGADVLVNAALDEAFSGHSGEYFDNDIGAWAMPLPDAMNSAKCQQLVAAVEDILRKLGIQIS